MSKNSDDNRLEIDRVSLRQCLECLEKAADAERSSIFIQPRGNVIPLKITDRNHQS